MYGGPSVQVADEHEITVLKTTCVNEPSHVGGPDGDCLNFIPVPVCGCVYLFCWLMFVCACVCACAQARACVSVIVCECEGVGVGMCFR